MFLVTQEYCGTITKAIVFESEAKALKLFKKFVREDCDARCDEEVMEKRSYWQADNDQSCAMVSCVKGD
jgi:hypothetical protein